MELFNIDLPITIAPDITYHGVVCQKPEADAYFQTLLESIAWQNDQAYIFGKHFITKRKVAWYGDENFEYRYSNTTKEALPWTSTLLELKQLAENLTSRDFNSCLLNLYHNGSEGMTWHSDAEKCLGPNPSIASFTFGAERKFSFKNKQTGKTKSILLQHGSLLIMEGTSQQNWLHRLPPTRKVHSSRINLTFRKMYD